MIAAFYAGNDDREVLRRFHLVGTNNALAHAAFMHATGRGTRRNHDAAQLIFDNIVMGYLREGVPPVTLPVAEIVRTLIYLRKLVAEPPAREIRDWTLQATCNMLGRNDSGDPFRDALYMEIVQTVVKAQQPITHDFFRTLCELKRRYVRGDEAIEKANKRLVRASRLVISAAC